MESTQPSNNRHEITVEEDNAREDHHNNNLEDNIDISDDTGSPGPISDDEHPNNTSTPTRESEATVSTTTATPQMFRQALAEVPDPSSFLQTPKQVDNTDLSWEIEEEEEEVSIFTILKNSFQATPSDFSFFALFDILWLHQIATFDFQQCINGSSKVELEDKNFKQFLLKLFTKIFKFLHFPTPSPSHPP